MIDPMRQVRNILGKGIQYTKIGQGAKKNSNWKKDKNPSKGLIVWYNNKTNVMVLIAKNNLKNDMLFHVQAYSTTNYNLLDKEEVPNMQIANKVANRMMNTNY